MNRRRYLPIVVVAAVALLVVTCGRDKPNQNPGGGDADLKITVLKSSLAEAIEQVILTVEFGGGIFFVDTAAVEDGAFDFGTIEVPAGEVTFRITGLNEASLVVYYGESTVTIATGQHSNVSVELLPAIPMVKLSPYHVDGEPCGELTTTIELYNIDRFSGGTFRIVYDPSLLEFEGAVTQADTGWDVLTLNYSESGEGLLITCTRSQGGSDQVPEDLHSLIDVGFQPLGVGETDLQLLVVSLNNSSGPIVPGTFYVEGQSATVLGEVTLGTVQGTVTDAITSAPVAGAEVLYGETGLLSTTTDQNGHYLFQDLPLGSALIGVTIETYFPTSQWADLTCNDQSITLDFQLAAQPGSATIAGLDEDDLPRPGVIVVRQDDSWNDLDTMLTNEQGNGTWPALPGSMTFNFSSFAPAAGLDAYEWWGRLTEVYIPPGGTVNDTIQRQFPFAYGVGIRDREGNPATEFYQFDTVRAVIRVDNRDIEAYALELYGQATRTRLGAIDIQRSLKFTIAESSADSVIFEMVPTGIGEYYVRPWKTTALIRGQYRLTDSWEWPSQVAFTVLLAPPDLVAEAVSIDETQVIPGQDVVVSATVANNGAGASGSFSIMAGLNPPGWTGPAPGDTIGTVTVTSLPAGSGETYGITGTIPADTDPGSYTVCIYVDYPQAIDETNENNNQICMAEAISVLPTQLDVDSTVVHFAAQQYGEAPATKQFTVRNSGNGILSWNLTYSSGWLEAMPASATGNESAVTVGILETELPLGTYRDTIKIANAEVADDSAFVEVVYTVEQAPPGGILVTAYDENGLPVPEARVIRYLLTDSPLDTVFTDANGEALWEGLEARTMYNFRVFRQNTVEAEDEFWADADSVEVITGQTVAVPMHREFPYASEIKYYDLEGVQRSDFGPDESIVIAVSVTNPNPVSLPVSVYVEATRETMVTPDFFAESPIKLIGGGTVDTVTFIFDPPIYGDYFVRARSVRTTMSDIPWLTDTELWPSSRDISVIAPRPAVSPDNLHFSAFAYEDLPAPQNFTIANAGLGTLNWTAAASATWLQLSKTSGTGSSAVTVSVNTTAFNPTTLAANIIVTETSTGAKDTVTVTYDVLLPGWTFGGTGNQEAYSVDTAAGGNGYIIGGYTNPSLSDRDAYVLQVSETGERLNEWSYDRSRNEHIYSIISTSDGGYAAAGYAVDGNFAYSSMAYLLKIDVGGGRQWDTLYGCGECNDGAIGLTELSSGGFGLVGFSYNCSSYDPVSGFQGCTRSDGFAIATDEKGSLLWPYYIGYHHNGDWDELFDVFEGPDGTLICIGQTKPPDYPAGFNQAWVMGTYLSGEGSGDIAWQSFFGNLEGNTAARSVVHDGALMTIGGYSDVGSNGESDFWVFQTNGQPPPSLSGMSGNIDRQVILDLAVNDQGYLAVGITGPSSGVAWDAYIVQFDFNLGVKWSKIYGGPGVDMARGVVVLPDGGCLIVGATTSYGVNGSDVWVLRLNADGTIWR